MWDKRTVKSFVIWEKSHGILSISWSIGAMIELFSICVDPFHGPFYTLNFSTVTYKLVVTLMPMFMLGVKLIISRSIILVYTFRSHLVGNVLFADVHSEVVPFEWRRNQLGGRVNVNHHKPNRTIFYWKHSFTTIRGSIEDTVRSSSITWITKSRIIKESTRRKMINNTASKTISATRTISDTKRKKLDAPRLQSHPLFMRPRNWSKGTRNDSGKPTD